MGRTLRRADMLVVAPPRSREAEIQSGRADVFMSDFAYTRRMTADARLGAGDRAARPLRRNALRLGAADERPGLAGRGEQLPRRDPGGWDAWRGSATKHGLASILIR
jgi:hypothetical protein